MSLSAPSREEVYQTFVALLPRGRAWQTHDGAVDRNESVLLRFLYALASVFAAAEAAIAACYDEFFAASAAADLDLWREDYGLPSACDLFGDDVAAKALCLGGTSAGYYQEVAARGGWVTTMRWLNGTDAQFPGVASTLHVIVDSAASTAGRDIAYSGLAEAGRSAVGFPNPAALICGLENILPAHCAVTYEVIE